MASDQKYLWVTYDGDSLWAAAALQREGAEIIVCQIEDPKSLGVKSWVNDKEEPEVRRRRLSLYDGIVAKLSLEKFIKYAKSLANKDDWFVYPDYNAMYLISEQLRGMGFNRGLFTTVDDFLVEKDRLAAKEFVKKYHSVLEVRETKQFPTGGVDQAVAFIQMSDKIWVVKSDGNMGETIVPGSDNLGMARKQVVSELTFHKNAYNKAPLSLEEKSIGASEFCPSLGFWNGRPIYSMIEVETRMLGPADSGPQTGGNQNLIIKTELDSLVNKMFFPPIIYEMAAKRQGLFIADVGILSDGQKYYYIENAGNRHGRPGLQSEVSMSRDENGRMARAYFEAIGNGQNPYRHPLGVALSTYGLESDPVFPGLPKEGLFFNYRDKENIFPIQVRYDQGRLVNVGFRFYDSAPLAIVVGRGDELRSAVAGLYDRMEDLSFNGLYYRSQEDFLSERYVSSIPNRCHFLNRKELANIFLDFPVEGSTIGADALMDPGHPDHHMAVRHRDQMMKRQYPD